MDISVVIPIFNKANTILDTVNSVLNQSYQPKEILIVNDGSTDDFKEKISLLSSDLIKILNQNNQGVSAARNYGVLNSSSSWVAFLDADDIWKTDFLKTIKDLHINFWEAKVLATAYEFISHDGFKSSIVLSGLSFENESGYMDNYFSVAAKSHPPICSSAICVNKEAFNSIGGFPEDLKSGEDLITWANLAFNFKVAYSKKSQAYYIHQLSNLGSSYIRENKKDLVGERLLTLINKSIKGSDLGLRLYLGRWLKSKSLIFLELGEKKLARYKALEALKFSHEKLKLIFILILSFFPVRIINFVLKK
jgi:glycosyltransferase involved in cell wall biosynthesis